MWRPSSCGGVRLAASLKRQRGRQPGLGRLAPKMRAPVLAVGFKSIRADGRRYRRPWVIASQLIFCVILAATWHPACGRKGRARAAKLVTYPDLQANLCANPYTRFLCRCSC